VCGGDAWACFVNELLTGAVGQLLEDEVRFFVGVSRQLGFELWIDGA